MLARNFMSAASLMLSDKEYAALIEVLGMLERGELEYVPWNGTGFSKNEKPNGFNMAHVMTRGHCGIVGCIKGWCNEITKERFLFERRTEGVSELFMYGNPRRFRVTVDQAAQALRNYLSAGRADWNNILGDE